MLCSASFFPLACGFAVPLGVEDRGDPPPWLAGWVLGRAIIVVLRPPFVAVEGFRRGAPGGGPRRACPCCPIDSFLPLTRVALSSTVAYSGTWLIVGLG